MYELSLPDGATVLDAIEQSGLLAKYRNDETLKITPGTTKVGIYGELAEFNDLLEDGDRVEIYRPLILDPMQARRVRAQAQKNAGKK